MQEFVRSIARSMVASRQSTALRIWHGLIAILGCTAASSSVLAQSYAPATSPSQNSSGYSLDLPPAIWNRLDGTSVPLEPAWRPERPANSSNRWDETVLGPSRVAPHWTLPDEAPQVTTQSNLQSHSSRLAQSPSQATLPELSAYGPGHSQVATFDEPSPLTGSSSGLSPWFPGTNRREAWSEGTYFDAHDPRENWDVDRGWLFGQSVVPGAGASQRVASANRYWWDAVGRAYYANDHRIEFSGQEATFGVEGIVRGGLTRCTPDWLIHGGGELYVTQPFDDNILVDSPQRAAFAPNFDVEVLEISQLVLAAEREDLVLGFGKFVTPFGRTYFPIFTNSRWETPFIRAEAIQYRETGAFLNFTPGDWSIDAALTNGGADRDTNSSKALVSRIGWSNDIWTLGSSVKIQDGIGSEGQKHYNHHVGMDAALRFGKWTACTEMIIDYYGYRRDGFAPGGITWDRSLYHRDMSRPGGGQLTGWGYYGGLRRDGELWTSWISYGEYYPDEIGDRIHDTPTRRLLVKGVRQLGGGVDWYGALMFETTIENAFAGKDRIGSSLITGLQIGL